MKKLISVLCVLAVLIAALCVTASAEETANWAYGALPLNSEDAGVGTIYYAAAYFEIEGITNPVTAAPYTEEEIAAIVNQEAEGEYIEAPEGAMIGMSVFGAEDSIFWYDADNASAIVSHADPLAMNTETGVFATADGEEVAAPMTTANWAYGALPLNSEDAGVGTIYYAAAYFQIEGITNPVTAAPYTEEEIAAIVNQEAEGEYIEAPEGAMIGMSVFGAEDSIFWYDVDNAAAIVSHADPLAMNAETGVFATAEGEEVAAPMA